MRHVFSTTLLIALLCFTLLSTAKSHPDLAEEEKRHNSNWVLFEVTHDGEVTLKAAKPSHQPAGRCKGHPRNPDGHVLITYTNPETGMECVVRSPDPRKMYHDHKQEDGKWGGGLHRHERVSFAVTLHKDVQDFHTRDLKNDHLPHKRHLITQDHHHAFHTMQSTAGIDTDTIEVTPIQVVGPLQQQQNIVFIASGYKTSEKGKFDNDVQTLVDFIQQPDTTTLSSQPYRRYFSVSNFFKVWHPSPDSGASHPAPAGEGVMVANNLDCTYGATSARILTCSREKIHFVGSRAPPDPTSAVYLVLINDEDFGGTGGGGVCTTYTGSEMKVIVIHEINHAGADLADEYDYGYAETNQISMKNCHWSNQNTPWHRWIFAAIIPPPTQVCTYSNYYKPTPSSCLMESSQPSMCPVCASAVLQSFYDHGLNLASPRFPGQYEKIHIEDGQTGTLYINHHIPYHRDETGDFAVSWSVEGQGDIAAYNTHAFGINHLINGSGFFPSTPGTYTIKATVEDRTNMLLEFDRLQLADRNYNNDTATKQISTFRVIIYNSGELAAQNCTDRDTPFGTTYCGSCDPGKDADCARSYKSVPLENVLNVDEQLDGMQGWLLGIGGLFIALGVLIFILIWRMMALHAEHNPREILPLTSCIIGVRVILLAVQITLLVASTASIIFSVYMYGQLSVFGRTLMLGVITSSVVVWFASFVGFCAAYYKNRAVLFVNFIILLLLFGCALLFTILILYMLYNINSESVKDQLDGEWRVAVKDDPVAACTLQSVLKCSGFNTSCNTVAFNPKGTANCPANCERSNLYGDPCFLRVRDFVESKFATASIGGILLSVFILTGMVLTLVLGCSLKSRRNFIHKERRRRHARGEATLTPEETAMLRREFEKIDKDGSGDISRTEFGMFYNAVMGVSLSPRELEEYFDKLDADGNGVLSFEEFVKVYVPQKERPKKSLPKTKSAIYSNMDAPKEEEGPAPGTETSGQYVAESVDDDASHQNDELQRVGTADRDRVGTAQSQLRAEAQDPQDLDLDLDEDMDMDESQNEEDRAREEAARVAQAQAEREARMKQDRPSDVDADLVLDDMQVDAGGTLGAGDNNLDLDIDLDDEQFE